MPSTRTSAGSRAFAASGWRSFQRSRPTRASALDAAREISMIGTFVLAPAGRRRTRALPLGRQSGIPVAGGDRRCPLGSDLRRRPAGLATARLVLGVGTPLARRLDAWRLAGLLGVVRRPRGVALALRLVPLRQLEQRLQRADRLVDPAPRVADPGEPLGHRRDRERLGLAARDLVPGQRRRDARVGQRPDRVGRGDGSVLGVLVVVEEDAVALLLPPLRRRPSGHARLDVARQRQSRAADLGIRPATLDAHVDVDPAGARRLRPPDEPHSFERLLAGHRDVADLRPFDARYRVEVDPQLVGMVEVVRADRVRVEVDAAEIDDPGQSGGLVDDDLVCRPTRRKRQLGSPDPVGRVLGRPLLEERLLGDPVHEPLERHRPAANAGQRAFGDGKVVVDDVELRVAGVREVDLLRVRDRDLVAADLDDLLGRGHVRTIPLDTAPPPTDDGPTGHSAWSRVVDSGPDRSS